jgi:hypothetical protein
VLYAYRDEHSDGAARRHHVRQYSHADGVFYGGRQAWSQTAWRRFSTASAAGREVGFIDLHAGWSHGYGRSSATMDRPGALAGVRDWLQRGDHQRGRHLLLRRSSATSTTARPR